MENKEEFDFRALRLDWLRLQVGRLIATCQISHNILLSLYNLMNATLRFSLSSVLGLHKCEQGPSSDKGLHRLSEGDEHDSVSHQDGGQSGRNPAGDV